MNQPACPNTVLCRCRNTKDMRTMRVRCWVQKKKMSSLLILTKMLRPQRRWTARVRAECSFWI